MNQGQPTETKATAKPGRYDFAAIESRWQAYWERERTFRTPDLDDPAADLSRPKYYILDFFPYPSGAGLHVGHPLGYCATDIIARYKRMNGFNVLHPIGFDAFGLPAEQYAVETNVHPAVTTQQNIDVFRRQLRMFGFSFDWDREVSTCDPSYYKFTQWMFVQLFESWYDEQCPPRDDEDRGFAGRARPIAELVAELEADRLGVGDNLELIRDRAKGGRRSWADLSKVDQRKFLDNHRLAFIAEVPVNWCPYLGTVLANEEVDSQGRSERGGHAVFRRPLRQWMLRITRYAERLLADLDGLDWPDPIKLMQRNWVGKSSGAEVVFPLADQWRVEGGQWRCVDSSASMADTALAAIPHSILIYTTRPDTLFGATYMVLAPEHPLVQQVTSDDQRADVDRYVERARHRSDLERTADAKDKTGVFTGAHAINPATGEPIPIWVADYVLMGYGTGAIMAVPGGDSRDFEFAVKFDLPIVCVNRPTKEWIQERVSTFAARIEDSASAGLEELAAAFPELSENIEACKARSEGLGAKTISVLEERVGLGRLVDHYVRFPKAWGEAYTGDGVAVQSPGVGVSTDLPGGVCTLNDLPTADAKKAIVSWLEKTGLGRGAVNFKLRDWLFSRQRYWGEPFPVLHGEDGETISMAESDLPLELPPMDDFRPTSSGEGSDSMPEPPLARAKEWVRVEKDGRVYRRDLNTMPQWAGSCWYYLRFLDPKLTERFCSTRSEQYWMPVDLYVGGAEHAVLHLLYARFWHKVMFDLGHVSTAEPFRKLFNQGMIQSFAFRDARGRTISPTEVDALGDDRYALKENGESVTRIVAKMSKALKNVVNPDEIVSEYGADTFRLYEMYMGPLDASKPWNTRDVPGLHKLCQRIWRLVVDEQTNELSAALSDGEPDEDSLRALHRMIQRVGADLEQLKLNTAIAAIFDFVNEMTPRDCRPRAVIEPFVLVFSPFAPHLAEELWHRLGHEKTLAYEPWPVFDESLIAQAEVELGVQVNGKVRARITVPIDADDDEIEALARADAGVVQALGDKTIRKIFVIKGRLVNIVAG